MSNEIDFILRLKDMVSGGMNAISSTATQAFKNVNAGLDASKKKMDVLPRSIAGINKELDKLKQVRELSVSARQVKDANKEIAKLQSDLDKLEGNKGGGGSSLMRRFGVAAVGAGIMAFAGQSVQAAMNYGATTKSFEVLTGSAQKGRDLSGSLNTLQQQTILGPEVFHAAQTMMSFGVATDKVVSITKQLGDVSMGNKDKFEALTLAFSQTQAAGRLMGQDLLQYVNAGFNPLQVMSERWKDFGMKSKKSVGELKEMMEKGQISSAAVAKAFELATSTGGKFNNMMNQIGETSYGKAQIMEGAWENMKINIGNALMPIADSAMQAGSKLMDFLNISKTVPATLMAERGEINALVGVIGTLNMGNTTRAALIQQLITKYPDLFKNIDIETVSNSRLLETLKDINAEYEKKIGYAVNDSIIGNATKELKDAQDEFTKYSTLINLTERGETAAAHQIRSYTDAFNAFKPNDWTTPYGSDAAAINYYKEMRDKKKAVMDDQQRLLNNETAIKQNNETKDVLNSAFSLAKDPLKMVQVVGAKPNKQKEFLDLVNIADYLKKSDDNKNALDPTNAGKDWWDAGKTAKLNFDRLKQLMGLIPEAVNNNTNLINDPTKKGKGAGGGDSRADGIIGGGGKNVIINLHKFFDDLNIYSQTLPESSEQAEKQMTDMMKRILNSANEIPK